MDWAIPFAACMARCPSQDSHAGRREGEHGGPNDPSDGRARVPQGLRGADRAGERARRIHRVAHALLEALQSRL